MVDAAKGAAEASNPFPQGCLAQVEGARSWTSGRGGGGKVEWQGRPREDERETSFPRGLGGPGPRLALGTAGDGLLAPPPQAPVQDPLGQGRRRPSGDVLAVGPGGLAVGYGAQRLVLAGLGSCVAIVLWKADARAAAVAHAKLPQTQGPCEPPGLYATCAPAALLEQLGGRPLHVTAVLVGGSSLFGVAHGPGSRNVAAAEEALKILGIPIVFRDVGGNLSRTVHVFPGKGLLRILTQNRIRYEISLERYSHGRTE